ncbi:transposase IS3/IS911 [Pseudomonas syringae pv. actinidiae ICMP 19073]|uniref:IS3 family transposase n=1 Tax=Pseudomonas syringae TaxID=317 RepID=UPI000357BDC8|nr:IS3 family transposase [Pseudomonas syringae]EPM64131.1 transposase IS3/IS911 [Pseudomonas syringae pv. actinidiae ICMP 19073]
MTKPKTDRVKYTLEFKLEAVRLVDTGLTTGADIKPVTPEQMEISRLRAELARVKMERDILEKATAYFAKASS